MNLDLKPLLSSNEMCNAPGAWHVTGWVLAWQTPRDTRDERRGRRVRVMEMRIIIRKRMLLKTISRWSSLYAHFPPCDVGGVLCDVTWDCEHRDMGHVTAWHCPGPRSSPESRVSKIILVPEMDRQNVNTAGSLEIRLYRISFPAPGHEMDGGGKLSITERNHESCSQLPTSSSWRNMIITQLNPQVSRNKYYSRILC